MSARPDVTVIVPTYQGERYLDECLASIAVQDLDGVEVLVVDDGSTDRTVEIARSFHDRIPMLRVVEPGDRAGAVGNVNRCIELARGRWIKPVFQDDLLEPGCLAAMRAARRRGVPLVVAGRTYRFEDGTPDWQRAACEHLLDQSLVRRFGGGFVDGDRVAEVAVEHAAAHLPQLNFVAEPVAILIERAAVRRAGGFDDGFVQLWDYELLVRLASRRGVVLVDEPLAAFRVHTGSETSRNLGGSAFGINVVDRLRLHVVYARARAYREVRAAAGRHDPPVDLTALALGVARAAQRLADELPEADRDAAHHQVGALRYQLPADVPRDTPSGWRAINAEIALMLELSDRELPPDLAEILAAAGVDVGPADPETSSEDPTAAPLQDAAPVTQAPVADVDAAPAEQVPDADAAPVVVAGAPRLRRRQLPGLALQALRTNQWWGHMLGPIVAFACLQLGWRQILPGEGIVRVVALVASAVALAGYGYVVNDTADVVPDRLVGKRNAMARLPAWSRPLVIVAFALVGAIPWLFISLDTPAKVALAGIYLVPIIYSLPPVRLKERHLLGPIADASNAFALPALFTLALFAPLGTTTGPAPLMVVGALLWTYGFGLRAIIKHQIDDASNDRSSGTTTLVGEIGEAKALRFMTYVLFPLEQVGFIVLVATVLTWSWGTVAVGVAYALVFQALRHSGLIDRSLATNTLANGWWMYWYQIWPALLLSLGLSAWQPWYLALTGFILLLFWPRVRSGFGSFFHAARSELARDRTHPIP
jgi:GT2 family glycosyltransferase